MQGSELITRESDAAPRTASSAETERRMTVAGQAIQPPEGRPDVDPPARQRASGLHLQHDIRRMEAGATGADPGVREGQEMAAHLLARSHRIGKPEFAIAWAMNLVKFVVGGTWMAYWTGFGGASALTLKTLDRYFFQPRGTDASKPNPAIITAAACLAMGCLGAMVMNLVSQRLVVPALSALPLRRFLPLPAKAIVPGETARMLQAILDGPDEGARGARDVPGGPADLLRQKAAAMQSQAFDISTDHNLKWGKRGFAWFEVALRVVKTFVLHSPVPTPLILWLSAGVTATSTGTFVSSNESHSAYTFKLRVPNPEHVAAAYAERGTHHGPAVVDALIRRGDEINLFYVAQGPTSNPITAIREAWKHDPLNGGTAAESARRIFWAGVSRLIPLVEANGPYQGMEAVLAVMRTEGVHPVLRHVTVLASYYTTSEAFVTTWFIASETTIPQKAIAEKERVEARGR